MNISSFDYHKEIEGIAANIASECMQETEMDREAAEEIINDTRLHETIDGHEWVIYTAYHLSVLQYSENDDYMAENFGADALAASLAEGLNNLHMAMAFWAMYADVQNKMSEALDAEENRVEGE